MSTKDVIETYTTGDWIRTYSGRRFYPLAPRPQDVCIEDIAHALSMLCRYTGHVQRFYSVAEHSAYVCTSMADRLKAAGMSGRPGNSNLLRWALLHDAAEAYVGDMTRPLKHQAEMTLFREVESRVQTAITTHFGLVGQEPALVREIDKQIIGSEVRQLKFGERIATIDVLPDMLPELRKVKMGIAPEQAEQLFIGLWHAIELGDELNETLDTREPARA
jgi:5'-deoxynucleotidase YfbR-like HD superfamily hydrolase